MGDDRLPNRVMSGELEDAGKRGPGGRRKSGRTAWQMIFDYLASLGTEAPPHMTLGYGTTAQYTKGAAGLWPHGLRRKKMHPINGRKREKQKGGQD